MCVVIGRLFYLVMQQESCHCMWLVAADAGLVCDKAAVIDDTINGTSVLLIYCYDIFKAK